MRARKREKWDGLGVEQWIPLVRKVAKAMHAKLHRCVDLEDLVQDGTFGLVDAIKTFDATRGVKFESFASRRIVGAIRDGIRRMDWVPRRVRSLKDDAVSLMSMNEAMRISGKPVSEMICAKSSNTSDHKDEVDCLMSCLGSKDKRIIQMYFLEGELMSQIGRSLGVTESRISQIVSSAISRMKRKAA